LADATFSEQIKTSPLQVRRFLDRFPRSVSIADQPPEEADVVKSEISAPKASRTNQAWDMAAILLLEIIEFAANRSFAASMPQDVMVEDSGLILQNVGLFGDEKAVNVIDPPGYDRGVDEDRGIKKRIHVHLVPSFNDIIRKSH